MKRYWKLISIALIIVLTIGTFYIQQSSAKNSYPGFIIKTISGDESEIKPLEIDAAFIKEGIWTNMLISSEGTEYYEGLSIVNEVFNYYSEPEIKRLHEEYRNFMRGKIGDPSKYYEDDNLLIYAYVDGDYGFSGYEPSDFEFEIAVLDKDSNDKTTFKIPLPDQNRYHYVNVEDVQLVNNELIVVTHNSIRFNDNLEYVEDDNTEMHVYSFDIGEEKLLKDEIIEFSTLDKENLYVMSKYSLNNQNKMGSNPFIVFRSEIGKVPNEEEGYYSHEPVEIELIAYNLETNEQVKMDLSEEIEEGYRPETMEDHYMYLKKISDSQVDIIRYNVETNEVDVKQTFDQPAVPKEMFEKYGGFPGGGHMIYNDKVYYVSPYTTDKVNATVFVGDIESGEILYEGKVVPDPTTTVLDQYELELYYFRLK